MSNLEAIHQHIHEQFELARKLHATRPCTDTLKQVKPEPSPADKAEPIFRRITTTSKHLRRDSVCYEIVEPNIENLEELFDAALISLGMLVDERKSK